jgi:hypothetical protein
MKSSSNILKPLTVVLAVLLLGAACQAAGGAAGSQEPVRLSVGEIIDRAEDLEGRMVEVTARFMGWKGSCRNGPPVTRSDWMLEDESGCIYVSGPAPPGLSPAQPKQRMVTIVGLLHLKGETPYLVIPR